MLTQGKYSTVESAYSEYIFYICFNWYKTQNQFKNYTYSLWV